MILIGDVHRKIDDYLRIVNKAECSIQLGDFGYKDDWDSLIGKVDPNHHLILRGNHDYPAAESPFDLGDYGIALAEKDFWFMRGAKSRYPLNGRRKIEGVNWWPNEELSEEQLAKAIETFIQLKPNLVLTHECPSDIKRVLTGRKATDRTSIALNACFAEHQPSCWYFGHHHKDWTKKVGKTTFTCLNELSTVKI